jgi:hypothetical protein
MPDPDPDFRKLACLAVGRALQGGRRWKPNAISQLQERYDQLTVAEANSIFDAYVLNQSRFIERKPNTQPGWPDGFVYQFYTDCGGGRKIFFKFLLDEDETDKPSILIVSAHPPSFPDKRFEGK